MALPAQVTAAKPSLARYVDREVVVGARVEALSVSPDGAASLPGDVAFVEDLGATLLVHVDIDAPPPRLGDHGATMLEDAEVEVRKSRSRLRVATDGRAGVRAGDRVGIGVDVERLHFFDPQTGAAITGAAR
jgi:multiple sugar transport system ATP-binding protein